MRFEIWRERQTRQRGQRPLYRRHSYIDLAFSGYFQEPVEGPTPHRFGDSEFQRSFAGIELEFVRQRLDEIGHAVHNCYRVVHDWTTGPQTRWLPLRAYGFVSYMGGDFRVLPPMTLLKMRARGGCFFLVKECVSKYGVVIGASSNRETGPDFWTADLQDADLSHAEQVKLDEHLVKGRA